VVLFMAAMRRQLAAARPSPRAAAALGALTVAAATVQYELLPILATATTVTLALDRRRQAWPYVAGVTVAGLALLGITMSVMGVPFSAKLYDVMGRNAWDPLGVAGPLDIGRRAIHLLPARQALAGILGWYPVLLALAVLGARDARVPRSEATLFAAFAMSYVYFHALAGDVWPRDLIPATTVFAPYAALGIDAARGWLARRWAPAVTAGLLGFALLGPHAYTLGARIAPGIGGAGMRAAAVTVAAIVVPALALLALRRRLPDSSPARSLVLGGALTVAVALNYHASLPWPAIYENFQMPGYEQVRARRERVCHRIRGMLGDGPLMASHPGEVSLYTGVPTVLLASSADAVRLIRARYHIPWLLVAEGALAPGVVEALPVESVLQVEGYTLYRFLAEG
jgi:hypothetical protein